MTVDKHSESKISIGYNHITQEGGLNYGKNQHRRGEENCKAEGVITGSSENNKNGRAIHEGEEQECRSDILGRVREVPEGKRSCGLQFWRLDENNGEIVSSNIFTMSNGGMTKIVRKDDMGDEIIKPLDIGYDKICKCPSNHINCLDAKEWIQSQVAVWELYYEGRDIRDKKIHPAVFPIALPSKCIRLFTHEGELVLDPFVGSGTTLLAAQDLNRNAVGFDLSEKYVNLAKSRLKQQRLATSCKQIAILDDAINIPKYFKDGTIALSVTSPPYANMLNRPRLNKSRRGDLRQNEQYLKVEQYSQNPRDLGTMEPCQYAKALGEIYRAILPKMRPKGHCIINVTDLWWENKRYPIHTYVIDALERAGYELRNIMIWDRRNIINGVGIFGWPSNYITLGTTFEYILDFWRPK